jgi:hypothetical protein
MSVRPAATALAALAPLALTLLSARSAMAQGADSARPYVFMITPVSNATGRPWVAAIETGFARQAFQPLGGEGMGEAVTLQAPLTRALSLVVRGGAAIDAGTTRSSFEGELRAVTHPLGGTRTYLSFGAGAVRGYDATNALRVRVGAGQSFARSRLDADVALERPLSTGRDAVDVVTALGWMRAMRPGMQLGLEAVGQDLEGFWNRDEAEGGARIYAGPSALLRFGTWQLGATAGPVVRASWSNRTSAAERPDPARGATKGIGVRAVDSGCW